MHRKCLLLALFILACSCNGQEKITVRFQVICEGLTEDEAVYVTGSDQAIGQWNPSGLQLEYQGNSTWSKEVELANPSNIEYKFTLGSWEKEAVDENGYPLANYNAQLTSNQTLSHTIVGWKNGEKKVLNGQITGSVKYHSAIKGEGLKDRDLVVWFPPGYDDNPTTRYPVLYTHDGQNVFDPATSSFGVDWRIDESLDSLIKIGKLPPMIVVGIYNTDDRTLEYTPGELGNAYMNLVAKIIKPFIDETYRTLPDRKNTLVGGSSAGGIISFMIAWTYPDIFSKALCFSPAFKSPAESDYRFDCVKVVNETKKAPAIKCYIDNGGIALESLLQPGVDDMIAALNRKKYKAGKDYVFIKDEAAVHNEAAWAKRFPAAIIWIVNR